VLLLVLAWQWFEVRTQDRDPRFVAMTLRYVAGLAILTVVVVAGAFLPSDPRIATWGAAATLWVAAAGLASLRADDDAIRATAVTDALSERFGLFVIIVLGEVVVGVADGLAEAGPTTVTMATGLVALTVGFGLWWNYFDFVGRRIPLPGAGPRMRWLLGHFPLTLSIAAAGAGMVSLVAHAGDGHTPAATAWLLGRATALALASLALILSAQPDDPGLAGLPIALWVGAGAAVVIAAPDLPPVWLTRAARVGPAGRVEPGVRPSGPPWSSVRRRGLTSGTPAPPAPNIR
jgi:low temperature requirement protein LtrA